jgi:hypothetical protein
VRARASAFYSSKNAFSLCISAGCTKGCILGAIRMCASIRQYREKKLKECKKIPKDV